MTKKIAADLSQKSATNPHTHTPIFSPAEKLSNSFFVTRKEAAQMLGCTVQTVDALARGGLLQKVGELGPIPVSDVVRVLRRGKPWMGAWKC